MNKHAIFTVALFLMVSILGLLAAHLLHGQTRPASDPNPAQPSARPYGIDKRTPWTTSRITGSPEPPHPYRVERVFPKLGFKNPLLITNAPGTDRLFVGEHAGKLYSFPKDQTRDKPDLFLDLTTELQSWDKAGKVKGLEAVYGLAFPPPFLANPLLFTFPPLNTKHPHPHPPPGIPPSPFPL